MTQASAVTTLDPYCATGELSIFLRDFFFFFLILQDNPTDFTDMFSKTSYLALDIWLIFCGSVAVRLHLYFACAYRCGMQSLVVTLIFLLFFFKPFNVSQKDEWHIAVWSSRGV